MVVVVVDRPRLGHGLLSEPSCLLECHDGKGICGHGIPPLLSLSAFLRESIRSIHSPSHCFLLGFSQLAYITDSDREAATVEVFQQGNGSFSANTEQVTKYGRGNFSVSRHVVSQCLLRLT